METLKTKTIEQALKEGNSTINQRIKQKFVETHVYCNINSMVEFILNNSYDTKNAPFNYDDVENLYSYPEYVGEFANFQGGTEEEKREELKRLEALFTKNDELLDTLDTDKDDPKINKLKESLPQIEDEIEELENLESEPQEVYEWYKVSNFLLNKLKELGNPVIENENIWGRCSTGQDILLDYAITEICANMEILEGQTNNWE